MHIKTLLIFFCFCFLFCIKNGNTQNGCTDPQAENYDPAALENDGSCEYKSTTSTPICLAKLPIEIPECSGMELCDGQLFVINDGGDGPQFYQIDTTNGEVIRSILIENTGKHDWEDMTQSEDHLFIGDFGNNSGSRKDLKILKIKKSDLSEDTVTAEEIFFNFTDQTDFTPQPNENDYDCEAFFYKNDSLYIFSKNWANNQTRLYVSPAAPGNYSLEPQAEFDVGGLVTSADLSSDGEKITLLCYTTNGLAFYWLLFDYQDFIPFSGNKRKIGIGTVINVSQVEGITFQNENEGFIGSENLSIFDGKLMHFSVQPWVENPNTQTNNFAQKSTLHFYPNPFIEELLVDIKTGTKKVKKIELFDRSGRRVLKKRNGFKNRIRINGNKLAAGMYVMKVTLKGGEVIVEKIVKR